MSRVVRLITKYLHKHICQSCCLLFQELSPTLPIQQHQKTEPPKPAYSPKLNPYPDAASIRHQSSYILRWARDGPITSDKMHRSFSFHQKPKSEFRCLEDPSTESGSPLSASNKSWIQGITSWALPDISRSFPKAQEKPRHENGSVERVAGSKNEYKIEFNRRWLGIIQPGNLPEIAPKSRQGPKRKGSSSNKNHFCRGYAKFRGCNPYLWLHLLKTDSFLGKVFLKVEWSMFYQTRPSGHCIKVAKDSLSFYPLVN